MKVPPLLEECFKKRLLEKAETLVIRSRLLLLKWPITGTQLIL